MKIQIPLTPVQKMQIMHAENITLDLSGNAELNGIIAAAAEAHLHIDMLHAVIKSGDLALAACLVSEWEG